MASRPQQHEVLEQLAHDCGLLLTYLDMEGKPRHASPESIVRVLRAYGLPIDDARQAEDLLLERRRNRWRRPVEPVIVVWEGETAETELRVRADEIPGKARIALHFEDGQERRWHQPLSELRETGRACVDGTGYYTLRLLFPEKLPIGYHRVEVSVADRTSRARIIVAPPKAWMHDYAEREWGVFLPLYALRSRRNWGVGDYTELGDLCEWTARRGGSIVGTLPLLATFLNKSIFEPSPYAPASRMFWNELFVDPERIPGFKACRPAKRIYQEAAFQERLHQLRESPHVHYREIADLKRKVLAPMAEQFFGRNSASIAREAFEEYRLKKGRLNDFVAFLATCEARGRPWRNWPKRLREGKLRKGDYDQSVADYHAYVQWIADRQVRKAAQRAGSKGVRLYLDLPVGSHADGYDTWRERDAFALDAFAGAPPDPTFIRGQNWGFSPLHPEGIREQGYDYLIALLHHHMEPAGFLRIDHVMGLHRIFWIPEGLQPADGVYVKYRHEEMWAVMCLESHKTRTMIVGEDLGTVPDEVPRQMRERDVHRLWVGEFTMNPDPKNALGEMTESVVASLNTHDMPTFEAFWKGLDIPDRVDLGLLPKEEIPQEREHRKRIRNAVVSYLRERDLVPGDGEMPNESDVLRGLLQWMGESTARFVLVNLEDIWLEPLPQNTPGTHRERPNWQRKAAYGLETLGRSPSVGRVLRRLNEARQQARGEQ